MSGTGRPAPPEPPQSFSDGVVTIRTYRDDDVDPHFTAAHASRADVGPWLRWCRPDYALADSDVWVRGRADAWASGTSYSFAIVDPASGDHLGGCDLNHVQTEFRLANLGYWVRSDRTRRGVASRATLLVARFGFEQLGLFRVEIVVAPDNVASLKVAEKVGAMREGRLRNRIHRDGRSFDAILFSLVPDDLTPPAVPRP